MKTRDFVGWYSPPNLRGTLDLVFECAFTIFVCTWTANHINVPPYQSSAGWRFWYKLRIMLLSLLTPEYTAGIAATELRTAVVLTKRMHQLGYDQWDIKHSFFVAMGGYMIECENHWSPLPVDTFIKLLEGGLLEVGTPEHEREDTSKTDETDEKFGSGTVTQEKGPSLSGNVPLPGTSNPVVLPWMRSEDIDNLSHADYMLKAVACIQIMWLVVQCIGRLAQNLALSQLEATTVAYASCALFAYAAWWHKPYDFQTPSVVVVTQKHPISGHLRNLPTYVPFDQEPDMMVDNTTYLIYVLGTFAIFGTYSSLHLLAWNLDFATDIEQQLWRWLNVSLLGLHVSLVTAAMVSQTRASTVKVEKACITTWLWLFERVFKPIIPTSARPFFQSTYLLDHLDEQKLPPWPFRLPILVLTTLYSLISIFLLLESFVGLRRMPMSLYMTVDWLNGVPHLG